MTNPPRTPVWIDSNSALQDCCASLRAAHEIAVDTEFMRTNTFYPRAALFQLYAGKAGGGECYLVDPLTIDDFSPLVELLTDPALLKIFHACSEDLEVFSSFLGCVPEPLVDTQIAASLLGYGAGPSYASLVEQVLDVSLEKGETRSDWLQRPLQQKQIHYAVQDVVYLLPLYGLLEEELEREYRFDWLLQDCAALTGAARQPLDLDAFFSRIKNGWKLKPQEQAVLKVLSRWREERARERDLPRNHLLHERVLWALARQQPKTLDDLKSVEGMERRKVNALGDELLELIARAAATAPADFPPALPGPLPIAARDLTKALKQRVNDKAAELDLPPEVLVRKADYDFIVRRALAGAEACLPPRLRGWRRELGEQLLAVAAEHPASATVNASRD